MHDTDRYVTGPGAGRLDVEAIERDGHGEGEFCELCGEVNPCSLAWAAERVGQHRTRTASPDATRARP